jgi:hypothetical protein
MTEAEGKRFYNFFLDSDFHRNDAAISIFQPEADLRQRRTSLWLAQFPLAEIFAF